MTSVETSTKALKSAKKAGFLTSVFTKFFSKKATNENVKSGGAADQNSPKVKRKAKSTIVEEFGIEQTEILSPIKKIKPPPNRRRPMARNVAKVAPLFESETEATEIKVQPYRRSQTQPLVLKRPIMQELSHSLNSIQSQKSQNSEPEVGTKSPPMPTGNKPRFSQNSQNSQNSHKSELGPKPPLPTGNKPKNRQNSQNGEESEVSFFKTGSNLNSRQNSRESRQQSDQNVESVLLRTEKIVKNGKSVSLPESGNDLLKNPKNLRNSDFTLRMKSHENNAIENPTSL